MPNARYLHDNYFKRLMSRRRVAVEFCEQFLPAHILKQLDLASLRSRPTHFISQELNESITDMLYSVTCSEKPGYIYILVEHQSSPDRYMPFRLMSYMMRIIERHLKTEEADDLPIVFPVVFYNGKIPYSYSMDFIECYSAAQQALAREVWQSPFHLIDLNSVEDQQLRKKLWSGTMALVMKHIYDHDFLPALTLLAPLFNDIMISGEEVYIEATLSYILSKTDAVDREQFINNLVGQLPPSTGESAMSIAEYLIDKGHKEGLEQGLEQGLEAGQRQAAVEFAKRLLAEGAETAFVAKICQLSLDEVQVLKLQLVDLA